MEAGEGKFSPETSKGQRWYIPARYVFVAVLALATFLNVLLMSSLPISMTVMVRRRNTSGTASEEEDTCSSAATEPTSSPNYEAKAQSGDFDWDEMTQSYILTASTYGVLVTTIIGGRVAELWHPKYIFIICYGLSAVINMLLPVTADWGVAALITFQALSGAISGPLSPVMMTICAAWFIPKERQLLGSIYFSAINLGSIIAGLVTGNLLELIGWRLVFYLFSSLVVGMTIVFMFLVYESPDKHPRISEEERTFINESIGKDERQTAARLPWKQILLSPPVWAHIAMSVPSTWLSATLSNHFPIFMRNMLNYTPSQIGYFSSISGVSGWIGLVVFGVASQWLRRKKYLSHIVTYHIFNGISTLIPAIILVCISFVGCNDAAILTMLILTSTLSGAYIGGSQLNQMDLAVNYTGTLVGLTSTLGSVIRIVAPTITGALTNNRQTLTAWYTIFYVAAGVKIVPFLIFLFFGSVEEQPWNRIQQEETDSTSTTKTLPVGNEAQSPEQTERFTYHTHV